MVPPYKLIKLDRRYSNFGTYQYMVEFNGAAFDGGIVMYAKLIKWCDEQWGLSIDVDDLNLLRAERSMRKSIDTSACDLSFSNDWAYSGRYNKKRVYLTSSAANWFQLSSPLSQ